MNFKGRLVWPPSWHPSGNDVQAPTGEEGILTQVLPLDISPPYCFWIATESDGVGFSAMLTFQDEEFYSQVIEIFKQFIGKPLSDLGSCEIDF
jgi:hypothetical protein